MRISSAADDHNVLHETSEFHLVERIRQFQHRISLFFSCSHNNIKDYYVQLFMSLGILSIFPYFDLKKEILLYYISGRISKSAGGDPRHFSQGIDCRGRMGRRLAGKLKRFLGLEIK